MVVQNACATMAKALELVCRLQRTMRVPSYPSPIDHT